MKKILMLAVLSVAIFAGCQKADFDSTVTGEALGTFTLNTPATNAALVLNAATPTAKVEISWVPSKPGVDATPIYKWIAALKATGNLDAPLLEIPSDNNGADAKLTLTQKQLDDALKAKGIADGAKTDLIWSVKADNGSTQLLAGDIRNISITRMRDGVTAFILLSPASATAATTLNPVSTADSVKFKWTKALPATGGPAITYRVAFSKDNFTTTLFTIPASNSGKDTTLSIAAKQFNDSLVKYGFTDLSQTVSLKWTVLAASGTWQQQADYINDIAFLREVNFYLVGSPNGWSIDNPLKMVVDQKADRYSTVYYTYIKLAANDEFKFFKTPGDWGSGYGDNGAGTTPGSYKTGFNVGGNFKVTSAGIYRLTIDTKNDLAYVQQKQVGVVGGMQGWTPATPLYGAYLQRDKFLIIVPSSGTDEFKFHDASLGAAWNFGIGDDRWWGGADGKLVQDGGDPNIKAAFTPYTRLIWDASNVQQMKYNVYQGKLRIIGGAPVIGDWNPANALDMDYQGNGVWKKSVTFTGSTEFKFVSAEGWDLNYGADGAGIIKEGGGNITLTAGTYTITVDEYNRTYTIL